MTGKKSQLPPTHVAIYRHQEESIAGADAL
jgi:hypothetical protein